ncbi:hypothetical protein [Streptomyces sp. NPDC049916]|uniref:hypothetical protein n=1 Tax=Streptomyces sp. NPDC049916 TaxID=3155156 RepID=UPI003442E20E
MTALSRPAFGWWGPAWVGSWVLAGVLLVAWGVLRAAQKHRQLRSARPDSGGGPGGADEPGGCEGCDGPSGGEPEDYGRAA